MRKAAILVLPQLLLLALAACGGGSSGTPDPLPADGIGYTPGVFRPSDSFAALCQAPRTGTDPWSGQPWPDAAGTALHEKHFLRAWTNETYLWFNEVLDRNPANTGGATGGVTQYFDLLKTTALTDTGRSKDEFHYTYDTGEYRLLASSGAVLGYGISWAIVRGAPPRQVTVELVQAGTPAALAGVRRGATLLGIDGVDVVNDGSSAGVNAINAALFDPAPGSTHTLVLRDRGSSAAFTVTLAADSIAFDAVPMAGTIDAGGVDVGYLLFNDHTAVAEAQLRSAVQLLADAQVEELVLDLRYNGGGFLDIASELAYMIAGPVTVGRNFEVRQFNSKYPTTDPISGEPLATPFHSTTQGFALAPGQPLPTLDLDRVFVLTSSLTCSASESIINGLRGIGIAVILVGGDTCGKPYGFYPRDNCGTTYFSIQFRGTNDLGFGEYAEGFSATRTDIHPMSRLPGCAAADDLTRDLGDPLEGQLNAALTYMASGLCPTPPPISMKPQGTLWPADSPTVRKPPPRPWENNRILR